MGVLDDGPAKSSGFPGNSTSWTIGREWPLSLGEASHVHQSVADNHGMDDRTTAAMENGLVGRLDRDPVGQTLL